MDEKTGVAEGAPISDARGPRSILAGAGGRVAPPMPCPGCGAHPSEIFAENLPAMPALCPTWTADLAATALAVRHTLAQVVDHLHSAGIGSDASGDLELALAELLNNIVEHGYAPDDAGEIRMEMDILPGAIVCRIIDRGRALPGGELPGAPPADRADLPRQQLPEGGFGWQLIHALTDLIRYRRCGGCNCLAFVLRPSSAYEG